MFKKILIANRGEIALRVICACKELGIRTVAIYSEADRHSLPVRFADEAICIGPPQLALSYLNIPAVISAAEIANVDAIHPGYGLLAENANFAEVCETSGIKFIGPQPAVMRLMGEKGWSRQRVKEKGVGESPSRQVTPELRDQIGTVLCKSLAEIGYTNAGTIEFLMDQDRRLHFIEMNTRIQVEHPVTEMVTDVDLVKSQIMIAAGASMADVLHGPIVHRGHAIECRINAEHPEKFTPSAGKITSFNPPGGTGVRVDTAAYAEGVIPPYYDSLIAKLIVRGKDRDEAVSRMSRALEMFIVEGVYTTIPLHRRILADPDFRAGNFDTGFIERFLAAGKKDSAA